MKITKEQVEAMKVKEAVEEGVMRERCHKIVADLMTEDLRLLHNQLFLEHKIPTAEELVDELNYKQMIKEIL